MHVLIRTFISEVDGIHDGYTDYPGSSRHWAEGLG